MKHEQYKIATNTFLIDAGFIDNSDELLEEISNNIITRGYLQKSTIEDELFLYLNNRIGRGELSLSVDMDTYKKDGQAGGKICIVNQEGNVITKMKYEIDPGNGRVYGKCPKAFTFRKDEFKKMLEMVENGSAKKHSLSLSTKSKAPEKVEKEPEWGLFKKKTPKKNIPRYISAHDEM